MKRRKQRFELKYITISNFVYKLIKIFIKSTNTSHVFVNKNKLI